MNWGAGALGLGVQAELVEGVGPGAAGVLELAARWGGCALLLPFGYAGICFSTPLAWLLALTLLCLYYKKIQGGKLNVRQEYSV